MSQTTWVCYSYKHKQICSVHPGRVHPTEDIYLHPVVVGVPAEEAGDLPGAPGHRGQGDAGRAAHPPPHHLQPIRGQRDDILTNHSSPGPTSPPRPRPRPPPPPSRSGRSCSAMSGYNDGITAPTHLNIGRPRFSTQPCSLCSMWIW